MKISIISDTHLGFAEGTEREDDSFENLQEALEKSRDCDVILLPGDIFDRKVPSQETVSRALNIFVKLLSEKNDVEIFEGIGKGLEGVEHKKINGIPIIAIHGTHERRTRGLVNPIEALERAGFLIHLESNGVILRKGEEKICVQGLSGVPDQYVEKTLQEWNPQPVFGCFNIFMLHQSLEGFLYAPHLVPLQSLPRGFDIYINGHIHNPVVSSYDSKPLVITGSTIQTQLNKESVKPRGFWIFDTKEMEKGIQYIEFQNQRKVYVDEMINAKQVEVEEKIRQTLSQRHDKKPVIRIKLTGKTDVDVNTLKNKYQDVALLSFKKDLEKDEIETKTIEEQKLSVEDLGKKLLRQNLESAKLNPETFETVFEMMEQGKGEEVVAFLRDNMNKPITKKPKPAEEEPKTEPKPAEQEAPEEEGEKGPTKQFSLNRFA
ncbi:MAG: DNA repair exonuclease [Nanoarchaeota archaeon]|nr:DNA repair exonuclease [Nanoarchaeota archaeon]MBU2519855.1 DNA repair exonuclease [Nanoarchaeota archaeon]